VRRVPRAGRGSDDRTKLSLIGLHRALGLAESCLRARCRSQDHQASHTKVGRSLDGVTDVILHDTPWLRDAGFPESMQIRGHAAELRLGGTGRRGSSEPAARLVRTRGPTIIYFGPSLRFRQLEDAFRSQAWQVARDRRHGKRTIATLVADGAITCGQRAIDRDGVPMLRMTDVVDGHVVVLAPEERHSIERLTLAEDISCGDLALTFGDHPVLDADPITRMAIGPACNVARGKHAGR